MGKTVRLFITLPAEVWAIALKPLVFLDRRLTAEETYRGEGSYVFRNDSFRAIRLTTRETESNLLRMIYLIFSYF